MSLPLLQDHASRDAESSHRPFPRRSSKRPASRFAWLATRARLASALLLFGLVAVAAWILWPQPPAARTVAYTDLLAAVDAGRVEELVVRPGHDVRGTGAAGPFVAAYPLDHVDALASRAESAGVRLTLAPAPNPAEAQEKLSLAVTVLILTGLGYFLFVHLRQKGDRDLTREVHSATTFADVAGTQGAAEELREMVEFLRRPEAFDAIGARIPKGALLVGPPGTGKTLLARAVAGEAAVPFFSISGSEVTGFLVGMGAHRLKSLFAKVRKKGGVIFIDEIDALGGKRGRNRSHNEDDRTLNQLLVEMDGFSPLDGVVVIAATNRPDDLDEALRRPGRFDRTVAVANPTAEGREAILRLHVVRRNIRLHDEVDLNRLARLTPGSSGADLANLLNESAIAAVRAGSPWVRWSNVESARDRMLLGKERTGFRALDQERRTVAFHEAGHALAGVLFAPEDGLHKVTIQARGQAMGVAFFAPDDDRSLYQRSYLESQILKGLAGRAAEEIVFGRDAVTSGAQNDLVQVNSIARRMVYQLGMGSDTGLLIHDVGLGTLSSEAHARMDREVRDLLDRMYERVRTALLRERAALDALATALLERETLDGREAVALMESAGLVRPIVSHSTLGTGADPLAAGSVAA